MIVRNQDPNRSFSFCGWFGIKALKLHFQTLQRLRCSSRHTSGLSWPRRCYAWLWRNTPSVSTSRTEVFRWFVW
jgi:hypothetical protein